MKNYSILFVFVILIVAGCTRPDRGRLSPVNSGNIGNGRQGEQLAYADSSDYDDIRAALTEAESNYTEGVIYYQRNLLDSSQVAFEEALSILAELDFDQETYPAETKWLETMLKEIESDYRLTLMTSGVLYSEGSAAAFRELFSDIKNFKNLKESGEFHKPSKDSVTYDVPIYLNDKVENSLAYLQTVAHKTFEKYLSRSTKYLPLMEKILEEEGLPHDIVYLPLIESGFNPHAYSYARAVGHWQFIYSTGKRYGLKRDWWYDQRRDFEKSTRAAARYLKDLYDEFNSWELALASYNGGEGRVRRMIRTQKTKDFWKLRLKKQTRNYVPLFMAAVIIAKQPEKYGFAPKYEDALEWETVEISKCMSFANISAKTNIPVASLEDLNPELIRGITPPNATNYSLRIPVDKKQDFLAAYDEIPSEKNTNWVQHRVRRGETVSTIAQRYGVSMSSVISANNLRRPYRIYVGQRLMVPTTGGAWAYRSSNIVPDGSGSYTVKRGDTLWEIARAHGVSLTSLKRANRLSSNRIYPGRKLAIPGYGNSSATASSSGTYVVRRGDSLTKIARKYGISVAALKAHNGLRSDRIYPGRKLAIPGYGNSSATVSSSGTYVVRRGDSLTEIARKYGISVAALKAHNRLRSNTIYPNMKLKIPQSGSSIASRNTANSHVTYKVRRGDSLWKIARSFNVTITELMQWNGISDPSNIKMGSLLKIYTR